MLAPVGIFGTLTPNDAEYRSSAQPVPTLLVALRNATSIVQLPDGNLLVGLNGGGIAEWGTDGKFLGFDMSAENKTYRHVTQLVMVNGTVFAGTVRGLYKRLGPDHWAYQQPPSLFVWSLRSSGETLLALGAFGELLWTLNGTSVSPIDLPAGVERSRWTAADIDGELLAITNGTDVLLINMTSKDYSRIELPEDFNASEIDDLALGDGRLVVATDLLPNIYDLESGEWVASNLSAPGYNWTRVFAHGTVRAGSRDGWIIEYARTDGIGPSTWYWKTVGRVPGVGTERAVTDLIPRADQGFYITTPGGTWEIVGIEMGTRFGDGTVSCPPSSDVLAVESAGGIVWTLTRGGFVGLSVSPSGQPVAWDVAMDATLGTPGELRDSNELGGVVYLAVDRGIWTYDLYLSSRPSRWNTTHLSGDSEFSDVRAVEPLNGTLYAAGPFGLDVMHYSGTTPTWTPVQGAPSGILDLAARGDILLVATGGGVWSYRQGSGEWVGPDGNLWAPQGPVESLAICGGTAFAFGNGRLYWTDASGASDSIEVPGNGQMFDLVGSPTRAGPVWGAIEQVAFAFSPGSEGVFFGAIILEADFKWKHNLGGAIVRDVALDAIGTAYLATDLGVQRVARYALNWTSWTTADGLSANDLRTLEVEPGSDRLWIGAYGGVDVLDTWSNLTASIGTEQGLPSNLVYDIMMREGDVWVGTDAGGAGRRPFSGGNWQIYNMSTGLIEDDVQALASLGNKVMFGTDSGVTVLDLATSSITSHTSSSTAGRLPGDWVWCELAAGGRIWVGTDKGLAWYDSAGDDFTVQDLGGLVEPTVRSLAQDKTGRLWVGTENGLIVLNVSTGGVEARLDHTGGLPGDEVLALLEDSEGIMWVGMSAGVAMVDRGARVLATYTTREGLVHDRVTCLAEHPDGTIWIGTAGGLSRLDRTMWHVLPQSSTAVQDLPDIAVAQEGVRAIPELPTEGDEVTFNVTVTNPSRINAIATIALMSDDGGRPGLVLDTAIAYTVASGCYTVLLKWTAVGGEVPLWIVADPDGRVPESDRRNNRVAFGLHVNRPPRISDSNVTYNGIAPWSYHTVGNFSITVRYSDEDGDPARSLLATGHDGFPGTFSFAPIAGPNDFKVGRFYQCDVWASSGENNYTLTVDDGMRQTQAEVTLHFNFRINVTGIDPGSKLDSARTIRASVVGPWEGKTVEELRVYIDNGTGKPPADHPWVALPELRSTRSGENLTIDFAGTPEGKYDLLVLAIDDRGLAASTRITGVSIVHPSEENPSGTWAAVLLMGMLGLGVIALMAARRRSPP